MSILKYFHGSIEPDTERAVLIQACDNKSMSRYKGNHRPMIEFRIVRVDEEDNGFCWADWSVSRGPAYMVADLVMQADVVAPQRNHFDGFRTHFEPIGSPRIDCDYAERMARTLKKVRAKSLTHPQSGNHVEMLIWVTDVAKSLGINQFLGHRVWNDRPGLNESAMFEALPNMRAKMQHVKKLAEAMCGEPLTDVA